MRHLTEQLYFIFKYISTFLNNGILPIKDGKTCSECSKLNSDYERVKIYTEKGLALIDEPIDNFIRDYYIRTIYILELYLAYFHIIGEIHAEQQEKIHSNHVRHMETLE